ncbi:hypothetical protein HKBW3S03_02054, partial [Candidatus Hakubella thermalkaliphila]
LAQGIPQKSNIIGDFAAYRSQLPRRLCKGTNTPAGNA